VSDGWSLADFLCVHAAALERPQLPTTAVHALGVGKVAATLSLTKLLHGSSRPRAVLLCGVAGAYPARHRLRPPPLGLAAVGIVGSDVLADEGVATPQGFLDLGRAEAGPALVEVGPFPAAPDLITFAAQRLAVPIVRGATVSTCSGIDALSAARHQQSGADLETMEGAAVAAVCQHFGVPLLQLRAISNWTGDRERGGWDLAAAMAALQAALRRLFAVG
jgi:futalosine hydrolase